MMQAFSAPTSASADSSGSPRLLFVGFDLANDPQSRSVLESMARAGGGRIAFAEDRASLTAALTAGVKSNWVGGGSYSATGQQGTTLTGWAVSLLCLNVLLLAGLLALRRRRIARRAGQARSGPGSDRRGWFLLFLGTVSLSLMPRTARTSGSVSTTHPSAAAFSNSSGGTDSPAFANDPVILLHGIWGSADSFGPMAKRLLDRGWIELPVIRFPKSGATAECVINPRAVAVLAPRCEAWADATFRAISEGATGARPFVRVEFAENSKLTFAQQGGLVAAATLLVRQVTGASTVRLVGHSMGGLAARAYLQSRDYRNDVSQYLSVATPHAGSLLPYYYRLASDQIPDLGSPMAHADFASHIDANSFTDDDGRNVQVWLPATLRSDASVRRLIGEAPTLPLFKTLYQSTRRRDAWLRALREMILIPRAAGPAAGPLARLAVLTEQNDLPVDEADALASAIVTVPSLLNKRYVAGASASGGLHNLMARYGRRVGAARNNTAFGAVGVALASVEATETLSDVLTGALILHSLATDDAFARLADLKRILLETRIVGLAPDPELIAAFDQISTELEAAQSTAGAFAVEVHRQRSRIAVSALTLSAELAAHATRAAAASGSTAAGKLAALGSKATGLWMISLAATWKTMVAVSDQWQMAQDASVMATLADRLEQSPAQSDAKSTYVAYAQMAFFSGMADALSVYAARFKDFLSPGSPSAQVAADYRSLADQRRLLGDPPSPCGRVALARNVATAVISGFAPVVLSPDHPGLQRLSPNSSELEALNEGAGADFGPLPSGVSYSSLIGDAQGEAGTVCGSPLTLPLTISLIKWRFGLSPSLFSEVLPLMRPLAAELVSDWQRDATRLYSSSSSTLGLSGGLFASGSDLVVPIASQSLKIAKVGWPLTVQTAIAPKSHLEIADSQELLDWIDVPGTGPQSFAVDRVLLVVDLSGSMNQLIGGGSRRSKLDEAKNALHDVLSAIPASTDVSLMAFGQRSCDVTTLAPFGTSRTDLSGAIDRLQGNGGTPLLKAMREGAEAVNTLAAPERAAVLVVTDGGESCDNRGSQNLLAEARQLGVSLRIVGGAVTK